MKKQYATLQVWYVLNSPAVKTCYLKAITQVPHARPLIKSVNVFLTSSDLHTLVYSLQHSWIFFLGHFYCCWLFSMCAPLFLFFLFNIWKSRKSHLVLDVEVLSSPQICDIVPSPSTSTCKTKGAKAKKIRG